MAQRQLGQPGRNTSDQKVNEALEGANRLTLYQLLYQLTSRLDKDPTFDLTDVLSQQKMSSLSTVFLLIFVTFGPISFTFLRVILDFYWFCAYCAFCTAFC
jgi:hypothetical protein